MLRHQGVQPMGDADPLVQHRKQLGGDTADHSPLLGCRRDDDTLLGQRGEDLRGQARREARRSRGQGQPKRGLVEGAKLLPSPSRLRCRRRG